jgi:hypothetical protein
MFDMTGGSMANMDVAGMKTILGLLSVHYVERLSAFYFYNPPRVFWGLWGASKHLLPEVGGPRGGWGGRGLRGRRGRQGIWRAAVIRSAAAAAVREGGRGRAIRGKGAVRSEERGPSGKRGLASSGCGWLRSVICTNAPPGRPPSAARAPARRQRPLTMRHPVTSHCHPLR